MSVPSKALIEPFSELADFRHKGASAELEDLKARADWRA